MLRKKGKTKTNKQKKRTTEEMEIHTWTEWRAEGAERAAPNLSPCAAVTPPFSLRSLLAYNATCTITKDTKREAI